MSYTKHCRNMSCLCCLWCRIKHYLGRGEVTESDHNEHAVSPSTASVSHVSGAASEPTNLASSDHEQDHGENNAEQVDSANAKANTTTAEDHEAEQSIADQAMTTDSATVSSQDEDTRDQSFATSTQSSLLAEDELTQESEVEQGPDELTRIKGIGAVIEKKLHALGITTFAQIAALDAEGIERINDQLSFKGRIEREEWVQQAKQFVNEK